MGYDRSERKYQKCASVHATNIGKKKTTLTNTHICLKQLSTASARARIAKSHQNSIRNYSSHILENRTEQFTMSNNRNN